MGRSTPGFLAFNRGLVSPKALARVDLERTRLSAAIMTNWLPKTQGAMTIRPGTKWFGSSLRDTGAEFIEFVASTDDVALPELTHRKMRVWLGDAHALALLGRPAVDTTLSFSDTGWDDASTGGVIASGSSIDLIPIMTGATTSGVTITASSQDASTSSQAWRVADDNPAIGWQDTGTGHSTLPSWLNVDFGADTGERKAVASYSVRAHTNPAVLANAPNTWELIASNYDTGTYATDTGKWTLEDTQGSESGWAVGERRTYETPQGDTGTVTPRRHWRLMFTAVNGGAELCVGEVEMHQVTAAANAQAAFSNGTLTLNATSIGALAKAAKRRGGR